jgi:hypothetical protein
LQQKYEFYTLRDEVLKLHVKLVLAKIDHHEVAINHRRNTQTNGCGLHAHKTEEP